ncbi:ECF transporter S component [Amedibacillus sp. YH-ame10]
MKNNNIKSIVISALGMALVFLATYLIKIPNGIQGYFNLGDGFIMLFASIVNPWMAFLIGGIGSALADIAGGYAIYFIPTLFIKGLEGILIAFIFQRIKTNLKYISYAIGALIMVSGYFVCDSFINDSWALGLSGIPANLLQGGVGIVIALLALPILKRNMKDI